MHVAEWDRGKATLLVALSRATLYLGMKIRFVLSVNYSHVFFVPFA